MFTSNGIRDWISNLTGYAAIPDWCPGPRPGECVLDLKGYAQVDSYSCGVIAGFQVVKSFYPKMKFEDFYGEVNPDPETGTSRRKLKKALRRFAVNTRACHQLNRKSLCRYLRDGFPVIVVIRNIGAEARHWVTLRGYGPQDVLITNNGLPLLPSSYRMPWSVFNQIWNPKGHGLVCRGNGQGRMSLRVRKAC